MGLSRAGFGIYIPTKGQMEMGLLPFETPTPSVLSRLTIEGKAPHSVTPAGVGRPI